MADTLEFIDVSHEARGVFYPGRLKFSNDAIIFRNNKTGKVDQIASADIEESHWVRLPVGYALRLITKSGALHRFRGFKETDRDKLSAFIKEHLEDEMYDSEISLRGWNWGGAKFNGESLSFDVHNKMAFEIPLNNVSRTTTGKNEVVLEFHQNDDAPVSLTELRFHVPPNEIDGDPVKSFYEKVLAKASVLQVTGDAIVTFNEVQCLTPRGRYDIKMFPTFLQLHGKTFDYKIPLSTVLRLFLLPHKDQRSMFFVVSVDPPIKQGQTRYQFMILQFNREDEETLELSISEEEIAEKYEGKLSKEMTGPTYELVSRVMKALVQRKITVPGSFVGHTGSHAVSCSYKAAAGLLYPLERGFIYVHKPPVHIRFDEVSYVNFARSGGSTRSFDFEIETKTGSMYTFNSIDKEEYTKFFDFVKNKKLRIKNRGDKLDTKNADVLDDMIDSDEGEEHDAYLESVKAEGKRRLEEGGSDLSSNSSSDEDFDPDKASGGSVAEEYDSNPPTTSSDEEEYESGSGSDASASRKKRKHKEEHHKPKKAKTVKEAGHRKKHKKRNKDPNAPKRPQSAYFLWLNEHREQIKEENPGISITEISKKAGEMWKTVDDKTEWEEKAKEAKKEYEEKMVAYKQKLKEEGPPPTPDAKPKKPKKPKSSPVKPPTKEGVYKSKEYISSSSSSSSETDEDDKPLKPKPQAKKSDEEEAAASSPAVASGAEPSGEESD